jgi:glycosyltransferase involved in cell wall biosynthesis
VARVLHLSNSPYASLEGAGPSLLIFRELARDCESYHVLAPAAGRPRHERAGNLSLHTLPGARSRVFALTSLAAAGHVRRHRIDAILAQDPLLGGLSGVAVGRALGVPVMLEVHTDLWFDLAASAAPRERILGELAMHALRTASLVRTSGPRLTGRLAGAGVDPARLRHVPYRVDTEFFAPDGGDRRSPGRGVTAVSVGRFVAQKGYLQLLDAVSAIPGLRLVLAGGGPLEPQLRARVAQLGLGDRVELRGWISREQQRDLLRSADLYLQPSAPNLGEWMPRTILEAMAVGLPVLATDVGGISDVVVDGEVGLLAPHSDPAALTAALTALAADEALRARLGRGARRRALREYAWEPSFDRYRSALADLAGAGAPGRGGT